MYNLYYTYMKFEFSIICIYTCYIHTSCIYHRYIQIIDPQGWRFKNNEISKQVSSLLNEKLNIDSSRIYFNFTEFDGSYWGHGGVAGRDAGTF